MTKSFAQSFLKEARTRRAFDLPVAEMTAVMGTATTISVWACMALHQNVTGFPVGLDAVAMVPAAVYPVHGLLYGAAWLGAKCCDAAHAMKKVQKIAAPSIDFKNLPGRSGPRLFY